MDIIKKVCIGSRYKISDSISNGGFFTLKLKKDLTYPVIQYAM